LNQFSENSNSKKALNIELLPILVLAFNRPDNLKLCLDSLFELGARNIYVSQDGPSSDSQHSWLATNVIIQEYSKQNIVYDFQILEKNLGLVRGVQTGIDWYFERVEMGLVIEDDIVLLDSALKDALELFKAMDKDASIATICLFPGIGRQRLELQYSTFRLSIFANSLAWGTKAHFWKTASKEISMRETMCAFQYLKSLIGVNIALGWAFHCIEEILRQIKSTYLTLNSGSWDIRWTNSHFVNEWTVAVMNKNSVEYRGFGQSATNTKRRPSGAELEIYETDPDTEFRRFNFTPSINLKIDKIVMSKFSFTQKMRNYVAFRTRFRNLCTSLFSIK
jgi:Glycosyl transferase family 2